MTLRPNAEPDAVAGNAARRIEVPEHTEAADRPEAIERLLTNPHAAALLGGAVAQVCALFSSNERESTSLQKRREREQSLREHRWARRWVTAMWLHFTLASFALGAVVFLLCMERLTESAAVPLLAGVVGSLFVHPKRTE